MRINEIFYSLQGEGRWAGTPAIFIRFSGCNLKCDFCDTNHLLYKEYSTEEILREIKDYAPNHIVLTGGEPTLQITPKFLTALKERGYYIHLETNGTKELSQSLYTKLDWITCSPKFDKIPAMARFEELKVVFDKDHIEPLKEYEQIRYPLESFYLQPCDRKDEQWNQENIIACVEYIKQHPIWKLSLQTQKILNIR